MSSSTNAAAARRSSSSSNGGGSSKPPSSKSETVNYLLLYEAMVRHQDFEYDATRDHVALTISRIRRLGRPSAKRSYSNKNSSIGGGAGGGSWSMSSGALVVEADDHDDDDDNCNCPEGMLTYLQMRRCLLRLGYTWNRSLLPPTNNNTIASTSSQGSYSNGGNNNGGGGGNDYQSLHYQYDDDVSVMSNNSTSTFVSGGGQSSSSCTIGTSGTNVARDIIATDAQLIMLLTTLVEMEERSRAERMLARRQQQQQQRGNNSNNNDVDNDDYYHNNDDDDDDEEEEDPYSKGLFIPEFIQAYKLIIGGMQSLQTYPSPPHPSDDEATHRNYQIACASLGLMDDDENDEYANNNGVVVRGRERLYDEEFVAMLHELRMRSRERTLGLLRLFGPNGPKDSSSTTYATKSAGVGQSAGESPTARTSTPTRPPPVFSSTTTSSPKNGKYGGKKGNKQMMTAKDGLLPRMTEEQIRKMVHSKDTALARIMEEHESEMNVMATNMEELKRRTMASARLMKKRRRRTKIAVVVSLVVTIVGGFAYEYWRREQVKAEIKTGLQSVRHADDIIIKSLRDDVSTLSSRLADAEATIRYEEARYAKVSNEYDRLVRDNDEQKGKWLLDRRDLEKCMASRKDLDTELLVVKTRNVEVGEEVTWCRERLQNSELAVLGMERAMKKSRDDAMIAAATGARMANLPTLRDIGREIEVQGGDKGGDGMTLTDKKERRPVFTEMKYNRSFRHAVILRQVYSGVAGIAVSLLGSALFPGIINVIRMLFIGV